MDPERAQHPAFSLDKAGALHFVVAVARSSRAGSRSCVRSRVNHGIYNQQGDGDCWALKNGFRGTQVVSDGFGPTHLPCPKMI